MKKVLITGASGGIGSSIANKFNSKDYSLILTSSTKENLEILKNKYGTHNFYYNLDFSDQLDLQNSLKQIANEHSDLEILVNGAVELIIFTLQTFPIKFVSDFAKTL